MANVWTPDAVQELALEIRGFGKAGGFRERDAWPLLERSSQLRSVERRAEVDEVSSIEGTRRVYSDVMQAQLESTRAAALAEFLQSRDIKSGHGRDVTMRRQWAGEKMGVGGRTWERKYEESACLDLAVALADLEQQIAREDAAAQLQRLDRPWPMVFAVLPFRYAHEGLDEALIDGFADDIICRLAGVRGLTVISPTAARAWMSEPDPLKAARERARVDFVLGGSIRSVDRRLHVALHIDQTAEPSATRWSASFDFDDRDFLGAQLRIADSVLEVLDPPDGSRGLQVSGGDTTSPEAYELYLRGSGLLARNTEPETTLALDLLEHALRIDANFANAHAQRGYGLWRQYFAGWAGDGSLDEARTCVDRALQLDPASVRARLTRIRICWDTGGHEEQLLEGLRAVRVNPGARQARLAFARALNNAGLADLALPLTRTILGAEPREVSARKLLIWNLLMTRAYEDAATEGRTYLLLNPGDANTSWAVAGALLARERYDEATAVCSQGLRADLSDVALWLLKGYVLRTAGSADEAVAAWEEGAAQVGARLRVILENDRVRAFLANIYACLGDQEAARRELGHVEERQPKNPYLAYRRVGALAELGDTDAALKALQDAIENGFLSAQLLRFDERLGLGKLTTKMLYGPRVRALEEKVDALRKQYSPQIEALVVAQNGEAKWTRVTGAG